jgi:iron(III) transport system ATP-binding protein
MLSFESIDYAYDREAVLRDVSFTAAPGEITCLVGPSGCGKTTLLRLAAGLLESQQGEIRLAGELLSGPERNVPPESRPVGLVFQEGALFPHLTVAENVGFGLPKAGREHRVSELLTAMGIDALGARYPHTLSGGQRQRVALARALAPSPAALLFDEPYANLDLPLKQVLRREVRRIVREAGTVGIFVTHDPDDVAALADNVVVMSAGAIEQTGTPRELYDEPRTGVVARLFGHTQIVTATLAGDVLETPAGAWPLDCVANALDGSGPFELNVRADGLAAMPGEDGCEVVDIRIDGPDDLLGVLLANGQVLYVGAGRPHDYRLGSRVRIRPRRNSVFAEPAGPA